MRIRWAATCAALALAACDAGNRASPGEENRLPGPLLAIAAPASGQVVPLGDVSVMLDLRNARRGEDSVLLFVDAESPWEVPAERANRPVRVDGLSPGAHVLRAVVVRKDARAHRNPEAFAVRVFHVAEEDPDAFAWRDAEGRERRFDPERDPVLAAWATRERDGPRSIEAVVHGPPPGGSRVRVSVDGGEARETTGSTPVADLRPAGTALIVGRAKVEVLEPAAAGGAAPVPGRPFGTQEVELSRD